MPPQAVNEMADPLIEEFRRVWQGVQDQLSAMEQDPARWRARRRLREMADAIESEMGRLAGASTQWVQEQLPMVRQIGYAQGVTQAGGQSFAMIDTEAARALADRLNDDLLRATDNVTRSTKRLVRAVGRDASLRAAVEGRTATQAADEMRRVLNTHRVYAMRYSDGSLHGLAEYSQMAMRTTTANAYNGSLLDGVTQEGVRFVEVFDGPGCGWSFHGDPEEALGKIVTTEDARAFPIAHPNCRRGFGARPDVTAPGRSDSVTQQQVDSQLLQDAERARLQRRRRQRRDRDRRGFRSRRVAL